MKVQTLKNQSTFGVVARALRYEYSFSSAVGGRGHHCFEHEAWCLRDDVLEWCEEQFGEAGERWSHSRYGSTIFIQAHDDAFAFRMRWC